MQCKLTGFLFVILVLLAGCDNNDDDRSSTPPPQTLLSDVVFSDSELASCVAEQAETNGWTYVSDVTQIICQHRDITSLEGMQAVADASPSRLKLLDFIGCEITDLEPLRGLTGLETLELGNWSNRVTDLEPLAGLTNLSTLSVPSVNISDLGPLASLTNLRNLSLTVFRCEFCDPGAIDNVEALAGLTKLTRLDLSGNQIGDLSPLSGLQELEALDISGNYPITDLDPLLELGQLTELRLWVRLQTGLTVLGNLANLRTLDLACYSGDAACTDLTPLAALINLRDLVLFTPVPIDPLAPLTQLKRLYIKCSCGETGLAAIAGMTNLESFTLTNSDVSDLEPLTGLVNLKELRIDWYELDSGEPPRYIHDITPLAGLTNLLTLSIRGQLLSDLSPLAGLTRLAVLELEDNRIDDIDPLAGLTELQQLILRYNNVKDLGPLSGLQALLFLTLAGNPVEDFTPLFPLVSLQELVLYTNPPIPCSQLDELEEALPDTSVVAECGG